MFLQESDSRAYQTSFGAIFLTDDCQSYPSSGDSYEEVSELECDGLGIFHCVLSLVMVVSVEESGRTGEWLPEYDVCIFEALGLRN